ncbi:hypothetical protein [Streptomyces sp. TRM70350]|uniref:hypothetical protein n=1 Tax=Streptomyces sp. TRM70350 TaxID=2856165 RepID=UPI002110C9A8|nr:hypothetical protein [Streptomyces sp. TRM70350]
MFEQSLEPSGQGQPSVFGRADEVLAVEQGFVRAERLVVHEPADEQTGEVVGRVGETASHQVGEVPLEAGRRGERAPGGEGLVRPCEEVFAVLGGYAHDVPDDVDRELAGDVVHELTAA